jgi:putative lipoprotein
MKKTTLFVISLLLLAGLTLAACGGAEISLTGTTWKLVSYGPGDNPTPIQPDTKATVTFGEEGKLSGNGGCNNFFGSYEVKGSKITFGAPGSTLMACIEPVMQQESAMLATLNGTVKFSLDGDTLTITSSDGKTVLVFTK